MSDVKEFVGIAKTIKDDVYLEDNKGHKADAKSLLGCLYSTEFEENYVVSDNPYISIRFAKFLDLCTKRRK